VTAEDQSKLGSLNKEKVNVRMFNDIEGMFSKMKEKQERQTTTQLQEEGKVFSSLTDSQEPVRKVTETDGKIKEIRLALNKLTRHN